MSRFVVSHICPKHGFQQGADCPECFQDSDVVEAPAIRTDSWVTGYWEHIDTKPIYIRDKQQLFDECAKRGQIPKAFMKPRSQGAGYELKRR